MFWIRFLTFFKRSFAIGFLTCIMPLLFSSQKTDQDAIKPSFNDPIDIQFAFNVGLGLLYFHHLQGNLTPSPPSLFSNYQGVHFKPIASIAYNRTPFFEASLHYLFTPWFKTALVYMGQSNVSIETAYNSTTSNITQRLAWATFRSNLLLNAVSLKASFLLPTPIALGQWSFTPYSSISLGSSWQSWTSPCVILMTTNAQQNYVSTPLNLKQKISANVLWGVEAGLYLNPSLENSPLSIQLGCRFVDWGRSGNIGVLQQQAAKVGPFKPISIQKVYSLVPFLGVQFNF